MDSNPISSRREFQAAVLAAVSAAVHQRARRLVLVDEDFEPWPLDDAALLDNLTAFVRLPGRTVLMLGRGFEALPMRCPRFVAWRRIWGHAIDVRRPVDDELRCPTLLLLDRHAVVELLDRLHWRGRVLQADAGARVRAEEVDALAQRSEPTFGATTLGL